MEYNTLKEKDTWILGTGIFIGMLSGLVIGSYIDYKPNLFMGIILLVLWYFCSIFLVACIKISDRLTLSLREDDKNEI